MDRRAFCASSVAAAIAAAAAGSAARKISAREPAVVPVASSPDINLYRFVYDERYPAGCEFGLAAGRVRSIAGAVAIDGDVTALWSRDLRNEWQARRSAIAGMTTPRAAFCLEQLAKDHWMRVLVRVDHAIYQDREVEHRLTGPEAMVARLTSALSAPDWPARIPGALAACRGAKGTAGTARVIPAVGRRRAPAGTTLVSFVIT